MDYTLEDKQFLLSTFILLTYCQEPHTPYSYGLLWTANFLFQHATPEQVEVEFSKIFKLK